MSAPLPKPRLAMHLRRHVMAHLYDESGVPAHGVAVYSLSDPRDIRHTRYVGQTSLPSRRFLQHLNTARLWFPEETPWWIKSPKLRPLYVWIRDLYADELRLPTMVVGAWAQTVSEARVLERALICRGLAQRLPLLNAEKEMLRGQIPLV